MYDYVLSTNARDEVAISEFVLYHLLIGFDFVFVIDHRSVVPIREKLMAELPSEFAQRVLVVRQDTDDGGKMDWINRHVIPFVRRTCSRYFMHLDADEYLRLRADIPSVPDLIRSLTPNPPDVLVLHWHMFGSAGLQVNESPGGHVLPTYTRCSPSLHSHFKGLVSRAVFSDPRYTYDNPHFSTGPFKYTNLLGAGECGVNLPGLSAEHIFGKFVDPRSPFVVEACLNHYDTQSREVFYRRKVRLPRDDIIGLVRPFSPDAIEEELKKNNEETCTDLADFYEARMRHLLRVSSA
jgi:hypothetical protein